MEIGELIGGGGVDADPKENGDTGEVSDDGMGGLMEVIGEGEFEDSSNAALGFSLFSFCLLLQNQTLTTSLSMLRLSETKAISSPVGLGFWLKALSKATLIEVSIEVLFLRRLLIASCCAWVRR